jgi:hypothetical protein
MSNSVRFSSEEKIAIFSKLEGYLQKLSPQFLVGYQKRYFYLFYFFSR